MLPLPAAAAFAFRFRQRFSSHFAAPPCRCYAFLYAFAAFHAYAATMPRYAAFFDAARAIQRYDEDDAYATNIAMITFSLSCLIIFRQLSFSFLLYCFRGSPSWVVVGHAIIYGADAMPCAMTLSPFDR